MNILLIMFSIVYSVTSYVWTLDDYSGERFLLRKLLEENTKVDNKLDTMANSTIPTNVTSPTKKLTVRRSSLAILEVVDNTGLVLDKVSTNQKIRLRIKALTTPDYQPPFVRRCWYNQYKKEPANETEPSKTLKFLDKGCPSRDGKLLEGSMVPFKGNGLLESQTELFDLMPLYDDKFTFLGVHCDVVLCHFKEDCYYTCSKGQRKWSMNTTSGNIELATLIEVKKEEVSPPIPPPKAAIHGKDNLNDYLIRGGRLQPPQLSRRTTEPPFLDKYQSYFTLSTLGVCALLLLCVIGTCCMYISYRNNLEPINAEQDHTSGHVTGFLDRKMTGLPNVIGTSHNGVLSNREFVASQPSEFNNVSAWPGANINQRSPYRETAVLTPSEAAVLEARRLLRTNQIQQRLQQHASGRRALETETRYDYGEPGHGRVNTKYSPVWNEVRDHGRDRPDITTSPVGGELYAGPSSRFRSPQSEPLIQTSPHRGRVKATSLLSMALNDYFDKYRI